jgi:hypothetical protein
MIENYLLWGIGIAFGMPGDAWTKNPRPILYSLQLPDC